MSVSDAAASGDHLKLLIATRERIADAIDDERTHPRDLAALTRRLQDVAEKIATLEERAKQEGKSGDIGSGSASGGDDEWDPADI